MSIFRIVAFLCILAVSAASLGCSSKPPMTPARNPHLTRAEIVQLLGSRDHQVVSSFSGSHSHIHAHGHSSGGNRVQVYETPSRMVESQLIEDRFGHGFLWDNPLMLTPLFGRGHGPDAALTVLYVYEQTIGHRKKDYRARPSRETDELLIRDEDRPAIYDAIRAGCMGHYDVRVRLHCLWMLCNDGVQTVDDMAVWLNDHSQEVRLAAGFQCQARRFPKASENSMPVGEGLRAQAQMSADFAEVLVEHLDDPSLHVAVQCISSFMMVMIDGIAPMSIEELGADDFWDDNWIYRSWHERVEGKEDVQQWWEAGGREAFIQAAINAGRERERLSESHVTAE